MGTSKGMHDYEIYDPKAYRHQKHDVLAEHVYHENGHLVQEIETLRNHGERTLAAYREFQLGLRWISLTEGPVFVSGDTVRFSPTGARYVVLHYDQCHDLTVDIPTWSVLDGNETDDLRVIGDENDFRTVVEEAMEHTYPWPADPTERWGPVDLDGDLDNQTGLLRGHLHDEQAVGMMDGVRVLVFRLAVATFARDDIRVMDECAVEIETLYKQWGLDVQVPDELRYVGRGPADDVVMSVDEFFAPVDEEVCEHVYR